MISNVNLEGSAIVLFAVFVALAVWLIVTTPERRTRRREHLGPSGEIQVTRTTLHPVTLRATRRVPAPMYLDLAARYGKYPETMGLWMAEKMIAADAGKLAELSRVTVDRDPERDEYVFQMTLVVVPADERAKMDGGAKNG